MYTMSSGGSWWVNFYQQTLVKMIYVELSGSLSLKLREVLK
jgi:hypothetical protein